MKLYQKNLGCFRFALLSVAMTAAVRNDEVVASLFLIQIYRTLVREGGNPL
jgi:hypothetical protein